MNILARQLSIKDISCLLTCVVMFFLLFQLLSVSLAFATYPDVKIDQNVVFDEEDKLNVTGEVCYNCIISVYINDELFEEKKIDSSPRIINWETAPEILEFVVGEKFQINYTSSNEYNLSVFGGEETSYSAGELSDEYVFDSTDHDGSQIILSNPDSVFGTNSKDVTFDDSLRDFSVEIIKNDLLSGENTIRIEAAAEGFQGAGETVEDDISIDVDKYSIGFNVQDSDSLVANSQGSTIMGSVSGVEDYNSVGFAYLINGPGEIISNTGLMRDIEVDESSGEFNFTVSSNEFREGDNSIDLIAYEKDNKANFVGFNRFEVLRDTTPPQISIDSVEIYESGSNLVASQQGSQISSKILTGYSTIKVNVDVDAQDLTWEYASTSPKEEVVINESVELDIRAKKGDSIVRKISDELYDGATVTQVVERLDVNKKDVEIVKKAYEKLVDERIPRNSQWFKEVATQYGIGHDLILTAVDEGGNEVSKRVTILYDDQDPELIIDEMEPSSFFNNDGNGEAYNSWSTVSGRTNQPNVDISFIVIGEDDFVETDSGNRRRISCDDAYEYYERGIWRNYDSGEVQEAYEEGDSEMTYSLQFADVIEFVRGELRFKSNSEGEFGSESTIQAVANGDVISLRTSIDPEKSSNTHDNTVCGMMKNEFGRTSLETFDVTYQGGNTDWNINSVTFNKNSINPYEIEAEPENSRYRTSVVIEMDYIGQFGDEADINVRGVQVRKRGSDPRNIRVASSDVTYFYEGENQKLNLYAPLEFSKRGIDVEEYPDSEDLTLEIIPRSSVSGYDIDMRNPEFTKVTVDYDKELLTDWLTPEMVDKGIKYINTSLKLTKEMRDIVRVMVPVGYISCAGARVWYQIQTAGLSEDDPADAEKLNDLKENLFLVCDRTFCTASPARCSADSVEQSQSLMKYEDGDIEVPENLQELNTYGTSGDKKTLRSFDELDVGNECTTPMGKKGRYVYAKVNEYEETQSMLYESVDASSEKILPRNCVPYTYDQDVVDQGLESCTELETAEERRECRNNLYNDEDNIKGLDVNSIDNSCYNEEPPYFDHTRTLWQPAMDPSDNIIESTLSGCIPETYQHLNQLHKIQKNIIDCLQDVKTGTVDGTYCERLVSISFCDAVTGAVFRFSERRNAQREARGDPANGLFNVLAASQTSDLMDDRYAGQSYYSSGRIQTENIASALCVFAINKDFSRLEESLVGDLETEVEVEPQYTQTMPRVRFDGYDPLRGEITTAYQFTHNGISGGSRVTFTYELICDKSRENGEYCPEGVTTGQQYDSSTYSPIRKTISAGGQSQEAIGIRDRGAQYVFNVLRTTVEYTINDEQKTRVHEEIIQRGPADRIGSGPYKDCSFSASAGVAGGGISCGNNFGSLGQLTYYEFMDSTQVAPSYESNTGVFYEGDVVGVNVFYNARGDLQDAQKGTLWYKSSCANNVGYVRLDSTHIDSLNGNFYVELDGLQVPSTGSQATVGESDDDGSDSDDSDSNEDSSSSQDDEFREGNCQLQLRMTGNDIELSQDTFDMDILEEDAIQTDSQTSREINEIYNTNYIVRPAPRESDNVQVEVVSPREDATLCVGPNGVPTESQIKIAGISNKDDSSIIEHTDNLTVELSLERYSQDPLEFDLNEEVEFENLLSATHTSGGFNEVDFDTPQVGTITIRGDELDQEIQHGISLRTCNN